MSRKVLEGKSKVVSFHAMKAYWGVGVKLYSFLASVPYGNGQLQAPAT
jgi:hypothetical protein